MMAMRTHRLPASGIVLTLLAAGLLLAAPAGMAEAQSVSFDRTSGVVVAPAPAPAPAPQPLTVTVTRSATSVDPVTFVTSPALTATAPATYGTITIAATPALGANNTINFDRNQAVLRISQARDDNWKDEKFTIALRAPAGTRIGPDLVFTTDDFHGRPYMAFGQAGQTGPLPTMTLTEGTTQDVRVVVTVPANKALPITQLNALNNATFDRVGLQVDPPDALGKSINLTRGNITLGSTQAVATRPGYYWLPTTVMQTTTINANATWSITAVADTTGFKQPRVTLTLPPVDLGPAGQTGPGPPLVVTVLSDEPAPTVSFTPTDIAIKEGGRTDTALAAEGPHGAEVEMVKLSMEGDALVDLWQGNTKLAPVDGTITVSLKGTNVARLSARSTSDRSLMDGQMKKKTWRITDADGAKIDPDANWFTVTVEGSTAVPALPLVAQLLLALFLAAGGARLYRRSHAQGAVHHRD